jgi:hypothetical protein
MVIPLGEKIRIGLSAILWFVLSVFCVLGLAVLLVWPWWVTGALLLAALVLALPVFGVQHYIRRNTEGYSGKTTFTKTASALCMLAVTVAAFPIYYAAYAVDARPSTMPLATLTDGKKTVVFQGMQHVGSERFYKSVVYDLEKALTEGYNLYYEGVQPSPEQPELETWFNNMASGGKDLSGAYKQLADTCGLHFQLDYFAVLEADAKSHPERHRRADVTYREMKDEYDRLAAADPSFAKDFEEETVGKANSGSGDILDTAMSALDTPSESQKKQMGFICRGLINMSSITKGVGGHAKGRVILDFRNKRLAEMIDTTPDSKIYVTYGAAHLPGLIAELQKRNSAWKIVSTTWRRVMANPENLEGEPL